MSGSPITRERTGPPSRWATPAIALALFALTGQASGDDAADPAAENPEDPSPGLYAPTLGRPVFVEPGGYFLVRAGVPDADEAVRFELVYSAQGDVRRYALDVEPGAADKLMASQPVRVRVPQALPRRTYDLEIRHGTSRLVGRHCIAVGYVGRALRLVHLANMNVGDLSAPEFDQRLVNEVNLLAPTLILATGDFLDATRSGSPQDWERLVDYLTRFDAPLVIVCGDHDDIENYSRYVAPSPIGLIEVGANRCLILYDHALAPIHRNPDQVQWVEQALAQPGFDGLTLVVSHDESPNLLRHWRQLSSGDTGRWSR